MAFPEHKGDLSPATRKKIKERHEKREKAKQSRPRRNHPTKDVREHNKKKDPMGMKMKKMREEKKKQEEREEEEKDVEDPVATRARLREERKKQKTM